MPRRKTELAKENLGTRRGNRDLATLPLPDAQAAVAAAAVRLELAKATAAGATGLKQLKAVERVRILTDDLAVALERLQTAAAAATVKANAPGLRPGLMDMDSQDAWRLSGLSQHEKLSLLARDCGIVAKAMRAAQ